MCGDQSSGKSSVLQAISRMSFPIKDNLCTRFATELILGHLPDSQERCKVSIQPDNDRSQEERVKLEEFQHYAPPEKIDISDLIEEASKIDPHGLSMTGLITKPDTLDPVLRNRSFKSRDVTNEERDRWESEFLTQGVWATLPWKHKGVSALRIRLSEALTNQMLEQLPDLILRVESELADSSLALDKLGASRATVEEQRSYLLRASYRFATLIKEATSGRYGDKSFGSTSEPEGYQKRLPTVVQNTLTDFAATMRRYGHLREIAENYSKNRSREVPRGHYLQ
ncbi:dynamin family protein [Seiridium cupressi]